MQKAIDIAKRISKDLEKNWLSELEEYDLKRLFNEVYTLNQSVIVCNTIVSYIIYAYDPDSLWLDLKKDRLDNKTRILSNLNADVNGMFYQEVLYNKNELVNISIFNFLETLKSWKWRAVFDLLEYSSKMFRFASQETETEKSYEKMDKEGAVKTITSDVDIETLTKVNKEKGILLEQAIAKRKQADELIESIAKEFVNTDTAVQADFNFSFVDTAKKRDILSWRSFIKDRINKKSLTVS